MPGRPCGSPSSRLPRRPMWPLESANTDSVCASMSRSSSVSRSAHGSTANAGWWITARPAARRGRATTTSAPCARSASACPTRSTPTTNPNSPCAARLDAGQRILEHGRLRRLDAERPRAGEIGVRRGLARADARARRRRRRRRPRTGPRCRPRRARRGSWRSTRRTARAQPAPRDRLDVARPSPRTARRRARGSAAARSRSCGCRARGSSRRPAGRRAALGQLDAARGEERAHAVVARLAVDVLRRSRATASNGTNGSPVAAARARRYSSNISLPGRGVHLRRLREHAVEVEQARGHAVGQPEHGRRANQFGAVHAYSPRHATRACVQGCSGVRSSDRPSAETIIQLPQGSAVERQLSADAPP